MNILLLCLSSGRGGLEIYAAKSVSIFSDLGIQCIPVCQDNSYLSQQHKENKVVFHTLRKIFYLLPIVAAFKLARLCEQNDTDILLIHWANDFNLAVLTKIFCRKNIKIVYIRQMAITRYKFDFYHRFLYRYVDRFVVISKNLYQQARRFLPLDESRLRLIYHGVQAPASNSDACDEVFRHTQDMSSCPIHIGLLGRIEFGKGQHLIVAAVKKLKARNKIVRVSLVGQVMDKKYFSKLQCTIKNENLQQQIAHYPFINNIISYMKCFDVIALTTYDETFGLVLIEAMRSGIAVIGSDAGGVPEIIENNTSGLLFESGNANSLAEQIEQLYDNTNLRKKLALAGKQRAAETFSEQQHNVALKKIITDVYNESVNL